MYKINEILVDECEVCVMPVCELEGNSEYSQGYYDEHGVTTILVKEGIYIPLEEGDECPF